MKNKYKLGLSALLVAFAMAGTTVSADVKKCASCHGNDWSKKALNKSKHVSEMTQEEIEMALRGYKDGTYGGQMKAVMKGQIGEADPAVLAEEVYKSAHPKANVKPKKELKDLSVIIEKADCQAKAKEVLNCLDKAETRTDIKECKSIVKDFVKNYKKLTNTTCGCSQYN